MFRNIIGRGWFPLLLTAVAVVSIIYGVSINIVVPVLAGLLCVGLAILIVNTRKDQLELQSVKLTQIAEYFNRRFMGNASFTIFSVIEGLFAVENPAIWEWARACDTSQRVFNTWCDSFMNRVGNDVRASMPKPARTATLRANGHTQRKGAWLWLMKGSP